MKPAWAKQTIYVWGKQVYVIMYKGTKETLVLHFNSITFSCS